MSVRVDARGVTHPTLSTPVSVWASAHIACCPDCAQSFSGPGVGEITPLPLEDIGIPPEPTGRARHRKEERDD